MWVKWKTRCVARLYAAGPPAAPLFDELRAAPERLVDVVLWRRLETPELRVARGVRVGTFLGSGAFRGKQLSQRPSSKP